MEHVLRPLNETDLPALAAIFNHYAVNSPAAFFEQPLPPAFLAKLGESTAGLPFLVAEAGGRVAGFGLLRPHHPSPVFARTAEIAYFLAPEQTRRGLGSRILAALEEAAWARGIDCLLACIASENQASLGFHARHGFQRCAELRHIGRKFGRDFSVVYMQKFLEG